jgi:hypothetical protein
MNAQFILKARCPQTVIAFALATLPMSPALAQTADQDPPYSVVDRGPFYRVLQRTVAVTDNATGQVSQQVQSYIDLGTGMNYLSNGQWVEAQDLIEVTATGAQATHGQMTGNFNSDITSAGAITLSTATETFQSHPIGLFYFDSTSGKVAQLGAVQSSVGTLYPPNVIVFSNVLSGVRADLMLVWAKNGFEQNLVLKQNPPPPESFSMSSSTTTFQLWTAMDSCPAPQEQRPVLLPSGLEDHILIFGSTWFPVGAVFVFGNTPVPATGQAAQVRLIRPSDPGTVPVAKSLVNISGEQVLIEEVRYSDLASVLRQLPQASISPKANQTAEFANRGSFLRPSLKPLVGYQPIQIASSRYIPKGVVLDYELSGNVNSFTFTNGTTYHIASQFQVGPGTATFQQNACIKLNTNAYLLVYGNVSCSSSGSPTVLTSTDDNSYGMIPSGSTANPGYAAAEGLWMYYQTVTTTLQNVLVRWAQIGVRYDAASINSPHLTSASFQDCTTGLLLNISGGDTFYLSQDTYCNVSTPLLDETDGGTHKVGSLAQDCGVVSVAIVNDPNTDNYDYDTNKNSQSECSFAVLDTTNIVAAFMNTHLSEYGLGGANSTLPSFPGIPSPRMTSWAVSTNNGTSFRDKGPLLPISTITKGSTIITNGAPNPTLGDAGDTCMAYDPNRGSNGTVYLCVNPSRETGFQGFRLWTSTDKGSTFSLLRTNIPGTVYGVDGPRIKLLSGGDLYLSGGFEEGGGITGSVYIAHSTDGGSNWTGLHALETTNKANGGAQVLQTPDGTVYAFWLQRGTASSPPYTNAFSYAWLSGGSWSSSRVLPISINSSNAAGSGRPLRFNGDNTNDWFLSNAAPQPAFANTNIYLAYADLPTPNSATDHGDIFLAELTTNSDHSLSLSTIRKVNNDRTSTDQWNPAIAANPAGTELFIGYYSRQEDPVTNSWIRAYGARAYITNGLANATFECFPVGSTNFLPLFAGISVSPTDTWAFDPVWPPNETCMDTNAVADGHKGTFDQCPAWPGTVPPFGFASLDDVMNFCADDYTWATADNSYFYFAWCDRSRTFGTAPEIRPDADINFAKIRQ